MSSVTRIHETGRVGIRSLLIAVLLASACSTEPISGVDSLLPPRPPRAPPIVVTEELSALVSAWIEPIDGRPRLLILDEALGMGMLGREEAVAVVGTRRATEQEERDVRVELDDAGLEHILLAREALVPVVPVDSSVEVVTIEELRGLVAGNIRWEKIASPSPGPGVFRPRGPARVRVRAGGHSSRRALELLGFEPSTLAEVVVDDDAILDAVGEDQAGLGFVPARTTVNNAGRVRAKILGIRTEDGVLLPIDANHREAPWPLMRPVFLIRKTGADVGTPLIRASGTFEGRIATERLGFHPPPSTAAQ